MMMALKKDSSPYKREPIGGLTTTTKIVSSKEYNFKGNKHINTGVKNLLPHGTKNVYG